MTEILDYNKPEQKKRIFSYLSFGVSVLSIICLYLLWIKIPRKILASESLETPNLGTEVAIVAMISCVLGLVFSIISFAKREPNSFFKWFGLIISSIIILIFIGSIAFATLA